MVTFLDTPGHEAFTAMRARGAKVTDIVILVVAADDGVMPQTIEAIHHAKAAEVPIVVAINKIDKHEANPDKVKQNWWRSRSCRGIRRRLRPSSRCRRRPARGSTICWSSCCSRPTCLELKAPSMPRRRASSSKRVSTKAGARSPPCSFSRERSGAVTWSSREAASPRARHARRERRHRSRGRPLDPGGDPRPVGRARRGRRLHALADERKAREIALFRQGKFRDVKLAKKHCAKLENLFENMGEGGVRLLPLLIKADVQGSQEALIHALGGLSTEEVKVNVVHAAVGAITESDVNLALASKAVIIGFNTRADATARKAAEASGVDVRYYNIIYEAVDEIKAALSRNARAEKKENVLGLVDVRQVFKISKVGAVAGCYVLEGLVRRNASVRVLRDNVVIHTGEIDSLKRFKDDVREVKGGFECGMSLKNFNDLKVGGPVRDLRSPGSGADTLASPPILRSA